MSEDRRKWVRFEALVKVAFQDADRMREQMTRNLSRGGCLVRSESPRTVGAQVPLLLVHPESGERLNLVGEVRRCDPLPDGDFGLGVMFVDLDPKTKEQLDAFVQSAAAQRVEATRQTAENLKGHWRLCLVRELPHSLPAPTARIANLLDGRRTIDEIREASAMAPEQATAVILTLIKSGLALAVPPGVPVSAVVSTAVPDGPHPRSHGTEDAAPERHRSVKAAGKRAVGGRPLLALGIALVVGVIGWNVWYWLIRPAQGRPAALDVSLYSSELPLTRLLRGEHSAYGVVTRSAWEALPDREARLARLAARLSERKDQALEEVVLSDEKARLLGTWKAGAETIY